MSTTRGRRNATTAGALMLVIALMANGSAAGTWVGPPGEGIDAVAVTVGTNFPDALGIGPGAGSFGMPILLVPTDPPIPAVIEAELVRLDPKQVVIIGGTSAVSAEMEADLVALLPNAEFQRLAGANRYETNAMFTEMVYPIESWVSITPPAFNSDPEADRVLVENAVWHTNADPTFEMWAHVDLPHGAEILEMQVVGTDTDPGDGYGERLRVTLYRQSGLSIQDVIAVYGPTGSPGTFSVTGSSFALAPEDIAKVDNSEWGYRLSLSGADGDPQLHNVMIKYRLGTQ